MKIAIPGAGGRMGGMLIREIAAAEDLQLVATTDRPDSPAIGEDAGLVAGLRENGVIIGDDPAALFDQADVVIDFSSPAASCAHAELAAKSGVALVVGTTGLTPEDEAVLQRAGEKAALVYCANTSVGVTLLGQIVEQVAAQLTDGWDIEIVEAHHHHKVDAPSGTALALGRAAARGRGVEHDKSGQLTVSHHCAVPRRHRLSVVGLRNVRLGERHGQGAASDDDECVGPKRFTSHGRAFLTNHCAFPRPRRLILLLCLLLRPLRLGHR